MGATSTPPTSPHTATASAREQDFFVRLSVELTGFSEVELLGTGVAPVYLAWLDERFADVLAELLEAWRRVQSGYPPESREQGVRQQILADEKLGPFARAIILLWYTAAWYPPPGEWSAIYGGRAGDTDTVAIPGAFPESLVWRAAGAHPSAAKPTGFGTWSLPPEGA
ncbi:MAG: hypothetical protein ABR992_12490 [Solirubrobacteraceae bacterium]|jgi:hypothetical protein